MKVRDELKRKDDENLLSYYKRITDNRKEYDLDYALWSELILGEARYGSENSRKMFYMVEKLLSKLDEEQINSMPKNKIEEITELIGELDIKKQETKNKINKLNKIKRGFIKTIEIANDIKDCLIENTEIPELNYERIKDTSNNKLIVQIQDWHIGYIINNYKGNYYNYEIAKKRLSKLLSEIKNTCDLYNIYDVTVVHCGDHIENTYMRENQSYECEFDLSHQIPYASKLLFSFISEITKMDKNVDVFSVGGNHNRMTSNKDSNIEGDNANVIIVDNLKTFVELSENKRIKVFDTDFKDDSCVFEINGMNIKAIHGDNRITDKKKMFDAESTMDSIDYKIILRGHDHNFNVQTQSNGGYTITGGCLFGYNPYSVKRMSCKTGASQTLIVLNKNDIECIKNVNLQFN